MINSVAEDVVSVYTNVQDGENIDTEGLALRLKTIFGIEDIKALKNEILEEQSLIEEIQEKAHKKYQDKKLEIGEQEIKELERVVMLKVVDEKWMNHIDNMDELKDGIGLRAYGQKDPVVQYRIEGGDMFEEMISQIKLDVAKVILHLEHPNMNSEINKNNVKITLEFLEELSEKTGKENIKFK